jgi:hypothetical protein
VLPRYAWPVGTLDSADSRCAPTHTISSTLIPTIMSRLRRMPTCFEASWPKHVVAHAKRYGKDMDDRSDSEDDEEGAKREHVYFDYDGLSRVLLRFLALASVGFSGQSDQRKCRLCHRACVSRERVSPRRHPVNSAVVTRVFERNLRIVLYVVSGSARSMRFARLWRSFMRTHKITI